MSIIIKTESEIEKMRIAGRLAAEVLEIIEPHIVPGVTTDELNQICHDYIVDVQKAIPAPLNYHGFPKSICTSVNHQICHGIPSDKKLKSGDIINIDITVIKDDYHGDTSKMFCVGDVSPHAKRLIKVTQEAMFLGIDQVKPGATLGDIGHAIQKHAESNRYSVVREFCGHGIGKKFHEEPQVLHYGKAGEGETLEAGMILTIEPMINLGKR
ncbi:MAG: type I methionyl aminopeptidase, partial [Methylobacter sp.]